MAMHIYAYGLARRRNHWANIRLSRHHDQLIIKKINCSWIMIECLNNEWRTNESERARARAYVPRAVSLIRQLRFISGSAAPARTDCGQTPLRASSSRSSEAHSAEE